MSARLAEEDALAETHEINVTPFIDVILVLLIIFMVAAPLATVDVPVDLPTAGAAQIEKPGKPIYVTLALDRAISVGANSITRGDLARAVETAAEGDHARRIFLRADKQVAYGDLMEVFDSLRRAGFSKVALTALDAGRPSP
jgi:biopolymer transport protein ExbD